MIDRGGAGRAIGLATAVLLLATPAAAQALLERGGRFVEVHPGGGLGRVVVDPDFARATARLAERADAWEGPVRTWRARAFVYRRTDLDWTGSDGRRRHTKVEMTVAEVALVERVWAAFVEAIRIHSGGRLRIEGPLRVLEEPLDRISGSGKDHLAWVDVTALRLTPLVPAGEVESVFVFWKPGDVEIGTYWGGSAGAALNGAGYTSIAMLGRPDVDERSYVEVAIHEWLHQIEFARSARMGCYHLPALHDAEAMGYAAGRLHPGWMTWLSDFLTVYTTPAMWEGLEMLRDARPDRPRFDDGFVRDWLFAGPFDNADDRALERLPAEALVAPRRDIPVGETKWRLARAREDHLDLDRRVVPNERVAALAHAYAHAGARASARLWVGSDDGVRVWLNGRLVHEAHEHRGLVPDQDRVPVVLEPGWNRFLFLVEETVGGWSLSARLASATGEPLDGVRWAAEPPPGEEPAEPGDLAPEFAPIAWRDVAADPWRMLPVLRESDLALAAGDPGLRLATRPGEVVLVPGPDRPGRRDFDPGRPELDNGMTLSREALAILPGIDGSPDLVLVRPDVAGVLAVGARPPILDHLIGRLAVANRPLLVARLALPRDPAGRLLLAREIDLFPVEESGLRVSFLPPVRFARGIGASVRLEVENAGDESVRLLGLEFEAAGAAVRVLDPPVLPLELEPGATAGVEARLSLEGADPAATLVAVLEGVRADDPLAIRLEREVELGDAIELEIRDPDGRAWTRASSGRAQGLVLRVANRSEAALGVRFESALPPSWAWTIEPPAGLDLAPGERRDLAVAIGIPAGAAGTVRVSAAAVLDDRVLASRVERTFHASPWRFVGPFDNSDRRGLERADGPETRGAAAADAYDTPWGPARWFDVTASGRPALGQVDLAAIFPERSENACAYAAIDLVSDRERRVRLLLGSDDGIALWVRGTLFHRKDVYRQAAPGQEEVDVRLEAGRNRILLKISQGNGPWGFFFGVAGEDGGPVEGVRCALPGAE